MAKKKKQIETPVQQEEQKLPLNFLQIGEHDAQEDKKIYISQPVYEAIYHFTEGKIKNESGGFLIGERIEEFGNVNILITGFVEAKHVEATPTTLTFTHKTWEYCHNEIEKKYKGKTIVGWIHTHPDFGIFLSEYDKFIQENYFKEPYQVALVIDPVQHTEGFYHWSNGEIRKSKGYYLFDQVGVSIARRQTQETEENSSEIRGSWLESLQSIGVMALMLVCAILLVMHVQLRRRVDELETQTIPQLQSQLNALAHGQNIPLPQVSDDQMNRD